MKKPTIQLMNILPSIKPLRVRTNEMWQLIQFDFVQMNENFVFCFSIILNSTRNSRSTILRAFDEQS